MMTRTSGMAEDVVVLLDYICWTGHRELHIVGLSMGGMIAQGGYTCQGTSCGLFTVLTELALKIPHRIASLILVSSKAGVLFTKMNLTPVCHPAPQCTLDTDIVCLVVWSVGSVS